MRTFSIDPADDGVVITAPSAHRPAHLLVGVPLVLYLLLTLPSLSIWVRACIELYRSMGPLAGTLVALPLSLLGALLMLAPGLGGIFLIAYEYRGVERVSANARRLLVTHSFGRIFWPRRYRMDRVRELTPLVGRAAPTWWAPSTGGLSFQYGRRCVHFAAALDESEAGRVAEALEPYLGREEEDEEARDGE